MTHKIPCWLIEAAWSRDKPAYMSTSYGVGGHHFEWAFDPLRALKFADKESADKVCMALRALRPELFPSVVPYPTFTEHLFGITPGGTPYVDPLPAPPLPTDESGERK